MVSPKREKALGKREMLIPKSDLKERLARYRQIKISVTGRKSGRTISIPVWFVLEGEKLYLLPVHGADTQWYKNVIGLMHEASKRSSEPFP